MWHGGLGILCCHCRRLGRGCGAGLIPGLGTSTSHRCSQKKKKKKIFIKSQSGLISPLLCGPGSPSGLHLSCVLSPQDPVGPGLAPTALPSHRIPQLHTPWLLFRSSNTFLPWDLCTCCICCSQRPAGLPSSADDWLIYLVFYHVLLSVSSHPNVRLTRGGTSLFISSA